MKIKKAFTLFELLVSISIIAILTAIAIVSYSGAQKKARDARRIQDIDAIGKALEQYYSDNTDYPTDYNDLLDSSDPVYLQAEPIDPKSKASYFSTGYSVVSNTYCMCADLEDEAKGNYGSLACGDGTGFYCRRGQQE